MKVIFWGLVIVVLCYAAYSGMIAAWSWIAVNNAVDEVISRAGIDAVPPPDIKTRVLNATSEAGVPLSDRDIVVTQEDGLVQVEVKWTIPVIVVKGDPVLAVPLSVRRASVGVPRR
jgi:hypothetical protein